jgi:hypothetical protein
MPTWSKDAAASPLEQSISEGIVSGNRDEDGVSWIQHSAPISPGSSGGALLSSRGELLGINSFLVQESQNLNFAVPAATLARALSGARNLADFLKYPPAPHGLISQSPGPVKVKPKDSSFARSNAFEFSDSPNVVTVRGSRWIRLGHRVPGVFATDGVSSWGPGAIVECVVDPGTCGVTQFYDGAVPLAIHTIYKVTRWDSDRIEAENGSVDIASRELSEGYRQTRAATCLIVNRARKQVFTAQKQTGQTCSQLDKYIDDGVVVRAEQLCAMRNGAPAPTMYACPNSPRPTDKHGKGAPTPTYHVSNRVKYCEDWVLNSDGEWEDHVNKCSDQINP